MATSTDNAILTLAQWFSPAFPVGGFHFSHGLEWAIEAGQVGDAAALRDWLHDILAHGSGRNDTILLAAAYARPDEADEIDATARALAASAERLTETMEMGEAFARIIGGMTGQAVPPRSYPVAVALAARAEGLPARLTAEFFLQAMVANLAGAAMRRVPLGQTDGQRVIRDLTPLCREVAAETAKGDLDDLGSSTFLSDIAAMKHETLYSRTFRT